jgi:RNA polymerase sigma-70 factor (ECF subfamily)
VLHNLLTAERAELVRQAISTLPALQREALVLFEYEELPLDTIATIAGADVGAIKARLRRARESLRRRLAPLLYHDTERSHS